MPLLVVMAVGLAPNVEACIASIQAQIYVPSGTPTPPPFATCATDTVNLVCVPAAQGERFSLTAHAPVRSVCVLSQCAAFPDFNIAWFQPASPYDEMIGYSSAAGNEGGVVPQGASYGVVYMRYGPDILGDDTAGAHFTYRLAC